LIGKVQDILREILPGGYATWVVLAVLAVIAFNSVYQVQADERGVVLRLGSHTRTVTPGLHFVIWPVETLEIVQGEGGVRPVPAEVLAAAREACDAHGALLIVDEVQTGIGRTGPWFAFQATDVVPDVITVAKALANGLPIGACVAGGAAADAFEPGDHGTTFGGNPVTCAAALAVLDTIEQERLLTTAETRARRLTQGLETFVVEHDLVRGVRGRGLLLGLELTGPHAAAVEAACAERYLIVNAVAPDVVRLAPPLTVTREEIDLALSAIGAALDEVAA
jgi:acetylornithine/N-succinyldiaminopimelate aminotransferase